MSQMPFPAYLFDYNGVIVDDEHVHWAAFREILAPLGIEMSKEDYWERYLGFDDVGAFRTVLADHGRPGSEAEIRELVAKKKPAYLRLAKADLHGFPGAAQLLRTLASGGAPIGIVSGALRDEIELGLDVLGVRDCVKFIVSAEDTRESKPDPEGYLIGRERLTTLGVTDASRALVIEDSISGIESAVKAGLACLAVAHSYGEQELRAAGAAEVAPRLADVTPDVLSRLDQRLRG
jgi:HAD superfamily hydrolase (TIGR01509 family)